jgi:3-(methylthio)propanoyl-CoA dehydrogenase
MLMLMKSKTEAMRALASVVGVSLDTARAHPDADQRRTHQAFADLMIPVVKGWCTENSVELASVGIQVHGGMGFVEETGAAQLLRDARITPIYEGTTGIQANDLIGRKLARDGGRAAATLIEQMRALNGALSKSSSLPGAAMLFAAAIDALERAVRYAVSNYSADLRGVSVGAVPLLQLFGVVSGGWMLLRSALIAEARLGAGTGSGGPASLSGAAGSHSAAALPAVFYRSKIETARFYLHHVLATAPGLAHAIVEGAAGALAEAAL